MGRLCDVCCTDYENVSESYACESRCRQKQVYEMWRRLEVNGDQLKEEKLLNIMDYLWSKNGYRGDVIRSLTLRSSVVVNLCLNECKIRSFTNIDLPNLVVLQISGCGMSEFRVNIPKIVGIQASYNNFGSFSGYDFPLLEELYLDGCKIVEFSHNKFPKLIGLDLRDNPLTRAGCNHLPAVECVRTSNFNVCSDKTLELLENPTVSLVNLGP